MEDLTGKKFGKLTVIRYSHLIKKTGYIHYWVCKCECGNELLVCAQNLRTGHTQSCGCVRKEKITKHGLSRSRLNTIYYKMKDRCYNSKEKAYINYGGRGITVCKEWLNDKKAFFNWAISNGYKDNLTIDRINTNGNYEPSNCRWVDMITQANNKRNNHYITYNGERHTLSEWAKIYNLKINTLYDRLNRNWNLKDALTTPPLF